MRILLVGDVVGKPGRKALKRLLPGLVDRRLLDFVIVNVENAAGGFGLTPPVLAEL
ncbi:MAG: YmdB family metallophosphoesterase, partial [Thermoanaerobaculia bacterium]